MSPWFPGLSCAAHTSRHRSRGASLDPPPSPAHCVSLYEDIALQNNRSQRKSSRRSSSSRRSKSKDHPMDEIIKQLNNSLLADNSLQLTDKRSMEMTSDFTMTAQELHQPTWDVGNPKKVTNELKKIKHIIQHCRTCPIDESATHSLGQCVFEKRHFTDVLSEKKLRTTSKGLRKGELEVDCFRITLRRQFDCLILDLHCSGWVHQTFSLLERGKGVIFIRYHNHVEECEDRFILHKGQVIKVLTNIKIVVDDTLSEIRLWGGMFSTPI
eukprot:GHVH01017390.1.p1 GENE.GHVH01017390.1~~GHVH01017390.1.p1  ORF type:complete len:269 (-),score=35.94 GHVH01017390.1:76-882(-)